jgi:hypothetical protein
VPTADGFQAIAVFGAAESVDPEMKRIPEQTLFLGQVTALVDLAALRSSLTVESRIYGAGKGV